MKLLEEKILKDGALIGDVVKVDGFLNHQVDIPLFEAMANEWLCCFEKEGVSKILTVESSGIALATIVARAFGVPLVFARKASGRGLGENYFSAKVISLTQGVPYSINVDKRYLSSDDRVLIIDDILANGSSLSAMVKLCHEAGAFVVGAGIAIEKSYLGGAKSLKSEGVRIEALAKIAAITDGGIVFE